MNYRKKLWGLQQGQGMSEYIIIIALIAITSIAAVRIFGNSIKYQMGKTIHKFLGKDGVPRGIDQPSVTTGAFKGRDMEDFDKAND